MKAAKNIHPLDRSEYEIVVTELPTMPLNLIESALKYKLRTLYPGSPEDTASDWRIVHRDRATLRLAVILMPRQQLAQHRQPAHQPRQFEQRRQRKASLQPANCQVAAAAFAFLQPPRGTEGSLLLQYASRYELLEFDDRGLSASRLITPVTAGELQRTGTPCRKIETGNGRHAQRLLRTARVFMPPARFRFTAGRRTAVYSILLVILLAVLVGQEFRQLQTELQTVRMHNQRLHSEAAEILAWREELEAIRQQLSAAPPPPLPVYTLLATTVTALDDQAIITSFTLTEDRFQLVMQSASALQSAITLRELPFVESVSIDQITRSDLQHERFVLSGSFKGGSYAE